MNIWLSFNAPFSISSRKNVQFNPKGRQSYLDSMTSHLDVKNCDFVTIKSSSHGITVSKYNIGTLK